MHVYERLNQELKYLNLANEHTEADKVLAICLSGKIHFAYENKMITDSEWSELYDKVVLLMKGVN